MGANAQTSVPTFTAGEILTAANMNISARTGIPVFADSTARDAAFGGTGEKTLAEGQFAYLESTNATQYYDGSTWQNVGGSSGLVCVKAETAVSAATSATADNVFTSTYTNYLIIATFLTSTTNDISVKFRAGGTATSANYTREYTFFSSTTVAAARATSQTSFALDDSASSYSNYIMTINSPQLAQRTQLNITGQVNQGNYSTQHQSILLTGVQESDTQFDGIEFTVATGTFTGVYAIYGYSKTV